MKFEIEGLEAFAKALDDAANGGLQEQYTLWLEAMGMEFLDLIQEEIIRTETVDTRRLLNSFVKGDDEGVWELNEGGLSLLVGTNLNYAAYANFGHMQDSRWVPGHWNGGRFVYEPGAKTGMMLSAKWVEGSHYWDNAFAIFERLFERGLERRLQDWLDEAF